MNFTAPFVCPQNITNTTYTFCLDGYQFMQLAEPWVRHAVMGGCVLVIGIIIMVIIKLSRD